MSPTHVPSQIRVAWEILIIFPAEPGNRMPCGWSLEATMVRSIMQLKAQRGINGLDALRGNAIRHDSVQEKEPCATRAPSWGQVVANLWLSTSSTLSVVKGVAELGLSSSLLRSGPDQGNGLCCLCDQGQTK